MNSPDADGVIPIDFMARWAYGRTITPASAAKASFVRAPETFLNTVRWPEFQQINAALSDYLARVTDKAICEAVYKDAGDAEEVLEPAKIGA